MKTILTRRSIMAGGVAGLAAAVLPLRGARAQSAAQQLVTVELFTSQGCSSCPPADALLGKLATRDNVLALSWPVDYWDYLGWRDTLAKPAFTERQRGYAEKLSPHQPYTPQIIIDGEVNVTGSHRKQVEAALDARLRKRSKRVPIAMTMSDDQLTVDVGAGAAVDATLWLIRYRPRVEVDVEGGENRGKMMVYSNVVESVSPLGMWTGAAKTFTLTRADLGALDDAHHLAVMLQAADAGPVLGAARLT